MKTILYSFILFLIFAPAASADYERNKAVPVEKVLFGKIISARNITQQELVRDKNNGWKTFGGALLGGAIGNQFGGGSGRDIATVLGAIIGGSMAHENNPKYRQVNTKVVELMIRVEGGKEYMVLQDYDRQMVFHRNDEVRMVYLEGGFVRIDKQM